MTKPNVVSEAPPGVARNAGVEGVGRRRRTSKRRSRARERKCFATRLAPATGEGVRGTCATSPGPPRRWRRPVRLQSISARGRGFAAYLPGCARQPLQRPRCGLRQGGLRSLRSASSLPFLVTCQRQVIPSHSFAALTALVVRRVNGVTALFVRRVNGIAALLMCRINGYLA